MAYTGKTSVFLPDLGLNVYPSAALPTGLSVPYPQVTTWRCLQPSDRADKASGLGDGRETRRQDPRPLDDLVEPNSLPIWNDHLDSYTREKCTSIFSEPLNHYWVSLLYQPSLTLNKEILALAVGYCPNKTSAVLGIDLVILLQAGSV